MRKRVRERAVRLAVWLALAPVCGSGLVEGQDRAARVGGSGPAAPRQPGTSKPLTAAEQAEFQRAVASYDAGDLTAAKGPLVQLARTHPQAGEVQAAAGMVLAETGDLKGALPFLERARRLEPAEPEVAANLGVAYLKDGRSAEAVRELAAAQRLQPGNVQTAWTLGQALLERGDAAGARREFARVRGLDPEAHEIAAADLSYAEALAAWKGGDGRGAVSVLDGAPSTASSAQAQALLGEIDEAGGRYESALAHLQSAAKLDASEGNVYTLGLELLRHWTFAPAAQMLEYGVEHYPESRRMRFALGIAYYGGSDFAKAIPVFRALLATSPDDATTADLLGRSCNARGSGDESGAADPGCADLTVFAKAHPGNAPAALYAAVAMLHRPEAERDTVAAEALLRQAIAADPKLAEAYYELGALEQGRSDWGASATALERAIALRPTYAEAHYRLSRAYAHLQRPDDARQQVALQQQYSQAEKDRLNQRLGEVMMFLPGGAEKKTP